MRWVRKCKGTGLNKRQALTQRQYKQNNSMILCSDWRSAHNYMSMLPSTCTHFTSACIIIQRVDGRPHIAMTYITLNLVATTLFYLP